MRHTYLYKRAQKGAAFFEYGLLAGLLALTAMGAALGLAPLMRSLLSTAQIEAPTDTSTPIQTASSGAGCSSPDKIYHNLAGTQVILDKNLWAPLNNGTPENPEFVCIESSGVQPSSADPWSWSWNIPGGDGSIIAYPNLVFGQKPWNGHTSAPAAVHASTPVIFTYAYTADDLTGRYNMAASSWLMSGPSASPTDIVGEVMVWVDNQGVQPAGTLIASDLTIGGVVYDLWHEPTMVDRTGAIESWSYFAFVSQDTHRVGTIPMHAFIAHLVEQDLVAASVWISSLEFGTEVIEGDGAVVMETAAVSGLTGLAANWDWAPIAPFSFPTTVVPYADAPERVVSDYVDIGGLEGIERPFTVVSNDAAYDGRAVSNVVGGGAANAGHLQYGTALDVATPAPGESVVVTLDIEGERGNWVVRREEAPVGPPFALTMNNGANYAQIIYADLGIPQGSYSFSLQGTGNSNPVIQPEFLQAGSPTQGQTVPWGIAVLIQTPPPGVRETITLVIDGQTVEWQVSGS